VAHPVLHAGPAAVAAAGPGGGVGACRVGCMELDAAPRQALAPPLPRSHLLTAGRGCSSIRLVPRGAAQVVDFARAAIAGAEGKQSKKLAAVEQLAATTTDSRQRTELEAAAKNEAHKLRQVQEVEQRFQQLLAGEAAALAAAAPGGWARWQTPARAGRSARAGSAHPRGHASSPSVGSMDTSADVASLVATGRGSSGAWCMQLALLPPSAASRRCAQRRPCCRRDGADD